MGELLATEGVGEREGCSSVLFIRHLDDLRRRLRRYRKIQGICDNARFYDCPRIDDCRVVHGDQIVLHFLLKWSPQANPVERTWWHLHEEIRRSHRCQTMEALPDLVSQRLENRRPFEVERSVYTPRQAA